MVRAVTVRRQRTTKVRRGKRGDFVGHTQLNGGVVKRGHRITNFAQHAGVLGYQVVVQVKAANRHQKHLPLGAHGAARSDQPCHDFQLVSQ